MVGLFGGSVGFWRSGFFWAVKRRCPPETVSAGRIYLPIYSETLFLTLLPNDFSSKEVQAIFGRSSLAQEGRRIYVALSVH